MDPQPERTAGACGTCTDYSRAYLHHLVRSGEILAPMLLTAHNLRYYADLLRDLRDAIERGALQEVAARFAAQQEEGDVPPR